MATEIKCPNCGHKFQMEDAVSEEYKQQLRDQMKKFVLQKEEEMQKRQEEFLKKEQLLQQQVQQKEVEFAKKLTDEKVKLQQSIEENLRKNISADFENQLKMLQQSNKDNEEKLRDARVKELDFLRREQELKNREQEMDIQVQKKLLEERERISEEVRKIEEQKIANRETEHQLRMKEMENNWRTRKADRPDETQSGAGLDADAGEVQELLLEDLLPSSSV